jgi:tRNA threonylcarbamoyl adenosine modification protein YjeE
VAGAGWPGCAVIEAATAVLDEEALEAWGRRVGSEVAAPVVFALRGDLGAGKSTLARAVARGAGVRGDIPSPTFNLLFRYPARDGREVVHLDLYRLEREDEVWDLGWDELGEGEEIVLIEWPERAEGILPAPRWDVSLEEDGPDRRRLALAAVGAAPPLPPFAEAG